MGNIWYNEPKTLDVAFDVIGDIVLSAAKPAVWRFYGAERGEYPGLTRRNLTESISQKYIDLGLR